MARLSVTLLVASTFCSLAMGQDTGSSVEPQQQVPEDPNSQVGSTVRLSPQMRVIPREDSSGLQEQELKELQNLLREYNRGTIRSKPLE